MYYGNCDVCDWEAFVEFGDYVPMLELFHLAEKHPQVYWERRNSDPHQLRQENPDVYAMLKRHL